MNSKEVKQIYLFLQSEFGCDHKFDFVFLRSSKDKVYVLNRDVELIDFNKLHIDTAGLYIGKFYSDGFRLSVEGSQLFAPYVSKNLVEVSDLHFVDWLTGSDLVDFVGEDRFVILKYKKDFLGCAKVKNNVALNSLPKARRLKVINYG